MSYLNIHPDIFHNLHALNLSIFDLPAFWMKAVSWYLWQIVFPTQVVLVKDIALKSTEITYWNLAALFSSATFLALLISNRKNKPALLGLVWFLMNLLIFFIASTSRPEMGIIIQPHWITFGSLGLFLLLASILNAIRFRINIYLWMLILSITFLTYIISEPSTTITGVAKKNTANIGLPYRQTISGRITA